MKDRLYSRFAGCLLGGAVGDALGYPVEFLREKGIEKAYGPQGIQTLQQAGNPAVISDDTQMTLFTANALLYGMTRTNLDAKPVDFGLAYREWLATQGDPSRMDDPNEPEMWLMRIPQLHVPRAPGNTCLSALTGFRRIGSVERPLNHSKGCGGVMRVAPIGLVSSVCQQEKPSFTAYLAAEAAAVTHGHPLGYTSAALLAEIVRRIVWEQADTLEEHICAAAEAILPQFDAAQELRDRIFQICTLAQDPHVSDLNGVHACGEGWTGDEALYVAIFCALRYPNDFAAALRCAVNHGGDSDSTGAICGNILGAWLGREAVAQAFSLEHLELRDVIENIAADLYTAAVRGIPQGDLLWDSKYRRGGEMPVQPAQEERRWTDFLYTPMTRRALALCFDAHRDQRDKSGAPYVFHPFHLAMQMNTEAETCAALLHDVAEDTDLSLDDLRGMGFPDDVLDALALLTHEDGVPYMQYVSRLRTNPIARSVKLADLRHNSNTARLDSVAPRDQARVRKYRIAQDVLAPDEYDWRRFCCLKRIRLDEKGAHRLCVRWLPDGPLLCFEVETPAGPVRVSEAAATRLHDGHRSLPEVLADVLAEQGTLGLLDALRE